MSLIASFLLTTKCAREPVVTDYFIYFVDVFRPIAIYENIFIFLLRQRFRKTLAVNRIDGIIGCICGVLRFHFGSLHSS